MSPRETGLCSTKNHAPCPRSRGPRGPRLRCPRKDRGTRRPAALGRIMSNNDFFILPRHRPMERSSDLRVLSTLPRASPLRIFNPLIIRLLYGLSPFFSRACCRNIRQGNRRRETDVLWINYWVILLQFCVEVKRLKCRKSVEKYF